MEFPFSINNLLGPEITRVDRSLMPYRTSPATIREYKSQLCTVIDKMGEASGKAQGLHAAVTSANRLGLSDHSLYIMKDENASNGQGKVVGVLKVGWKKLFVYDPDGRQVETEPLCALDFYVHESRQRSGCGRKLFEFMLQAEKMEAHQVAIDRPSHKFLSFLAKHYSLKASVNQVNNFVVFDKYFKTQGRGNQRRRSDGHKPPQHPYRKAGFNQTPQSKDPRPTSSLLSSRGSSRPETAASAAERQKEALCDVGIDRQASQDRFSAHSRPSSGRGNERKTSGSHGSEERRLQNSLYSRHTLGQVDCELSLAKMAHNTGRPASPPSINRDGPSRDFLQMRRQGSSLNSVTSTGDNPSRPCQNNRLANGSATQPEASPSDTLLSQSAKPRPANSAWNIFGVTTTSSTSQSDPYIKYRYYKQW